MMKFGVFLFVAILVVLTGEGNGFSSRDTIEEMLKERNIQVGYDEERGRVVAVKTRSVQMKVEGSSRELHLVEDYDFPDDANDDFETRRFKAVWKAYADGLAEIATLVKASINNRETKGEDGKVKWMTTEMASSLPLNGVVTIEMSESLTANGEYEVTVAVCQSKKRKEALADGESRPGKYSLAEWVERTIDKGAGGIICPQSYCDNEGIWWRVAGVPVELDAGRNLKKVVMATEKAKRYAYEAAMRTLAVRVSAHMSISRSSASKKTSNMISLENKFERVVKIEPMNMVLPVSQVKWFEFVKENPFTGKPVQYVVAALRSGARKSEENIAKNSLRNFRNAFDGKRKEW